MHMPSHGSDQAHPHIGHQLSVLQEIAWEQLVDES
jgi:hypothetical protein